MVWYKKLTLGGMHQRNEPVKTEYSETNKMSQQSCIEHNLNWIKWSTIAKFHVAILLIYCIMVL